MSKPIDHCAGYYDRQRPVAQCADCLRRPHPLPERGYWMAPPDFEVDCHEKLPKKETK